jgi:hypothetical protein
MSSGPFPCDTPIERIHYGQWIGRLWRISPVSDWRKAAHRPRAARWHTQGPDVLYTSTCETLAALEALAHLDENPKPHRLLSLDFPGGATLRVVDPGALPRDWKRDMAATRAIGDAVRDERPAVGAVRARTADRECARESRRAAGCFVREGPGRRRSRAVPLQSAPETAMSFAIKPKQRLPAAAGAEAGTASDRTG